MCQTPPLYAVRSHPFRCGRNRSRASPWLLLLLLRSWSGQPCASLVSHNHKHNPLHPCPDSRRKTRLPTKPCVVRESRTTTLRAPPQKNLKLDDPPGVLLPIRQYSLISWPISCVKV